MRIKHFRNRSSIRILLAICVLFFVACDNDEFSQSQTDPAPVIALQLSVDKAKFTGACPHTFTFSGIITASAAGVVHYRFEDLEFNDDLDPSKRFEGSVLFNSAGSQTVTWQLAFNESRTTNVILEIPSQNFLASNLLEVTATCR